jgi:hypothetical protein
MVHKVKGRVLMPNLVTDGGRTLPVAADPVAATGATLGKFERSIRVARFYLTNLTADVLAANDYGSKKLCDLPNTALVIVGAVVDLTAAVTGTGSSLANVDLAIGTVATASANFSTAGEDNLVAKIDCTAQGVIDGASGATETNVFVAAGTNAVYINVATGDISTAGTVVLNGVVDLLYIDVGKAL